MIALMALHHDELVELHTPQKVILNDIDVWINFNISKFACFACDHSVEIDDIIL